jgi:Putative restriction endonuclease
MVVAGTASVRPLGRQSGLDSVPLPFAEFSTTDCRLLRRQTHRGILHGRSVELLAGEIVEISPETSIHYTTAKRGAKYLEELPSDKADVRFNDPIILADSEPEPDIAVVRLPESADNDRHLNSQDIALCARMQYGYFLEGVLRTPSKK